MGIARYQQWKDKITSRWLVAAFGMEEMMTHLLMKYRLRWLGHLARMEPNRLPKQILYGELDKKRPRHGTRKRWRDVVTADIKAVGVSENWYEVAQDRQAWQALCRDGILSLVEQHSQGWPPGAAPTSEDTAHVCACGRSFRRRGDLTRHNRFCAVAGTAAP